MLKRKIFLSILFFYQGRLTYFAKQYTLLTIRMAEIWICGCVEERERECVCVCVCERERESEREGGT